MKAHFHHEVAGHFRLEVVRPDGTRRVVAEFDNLITDWGLDRMGANSDWLTACHVGSGNAAPANGDTALGNRIATTSNVVSNSAGRASSAPYYAWRKRVYRFAAGAAAGNLAEVGIGISDTSGSYTFSRALIRDGMGDPTTITILADEILDVTYEFRFYAPSADATGAVTDPETSISHNWTGRAARVTDGDWWHINPAGTSMRENFSENNFSPKAYDGDIQAVTQEPSGTSDTIGGAPDPYTAGNYYTDMVFALGLADANFTPAGVGAVFVRHGIGSYQLSFDPKPAKTADDELTLTTRVSWSRRP